VVDHPRLDALVHPCKQFRVLLAVSPHDTPRLGVAILDAAAPESSASVGDLAALVEIAADIVQLVAVELEGPAGGLQRVDRLERAWRLEPVRYQPRVDFLDVERIAVVGADDICLIHETMQYAAKILIIVSAALVARKVRKRRRLNGLFIGPLVETSGYRCRGPRRRPRIWRALAPRCHQNRRSFDIEEQELWPHEAANSMHACSLGNVASLYAKTPDGFSDGDPLTMRKIATTSLNIEFPYFPSNEIIYRPAQERGPAGRRGVRSPASVYPQPLA
jgi:hypothetical protein